MILFFSFFSFACSLTASMFSALMCTFLLTASEEMVDLW